MCFAVWTIFSIIGIRIKQELGLSETEFGLLVGTPILSGSLARIMLGVWTDRFGGRLVYSAIMLAAAIATFLLAFAHTYPQMLIAALGVGLAGVPSLSGLPTFRASTRLRSRARRSAYSASAMSARQSRNSWRPL